MARAANGKAPSRRDLFIGLAGLGALAWGWQWFLARTPEIAFLPLPGLDGWRQMETGAISAGSPTDAVFLGIGDEAPTRLAPDALCALLYPDGGAGTVALFTDVQCPNCQSLDTKLQARADRIRINRIELPLLGPRSDIVAKARLAEVLNAAPGGPEVAARLARNHAAAETLGIWGTPAMTIGTTLVMGDVPSDQLDRLLEMDHGHCG